MTQNKLDKMCCPFDKNELTLEIFFQNNEEILEGLFTCHSCQRYFPIIAGIPIMVPDEFREVSFEQGFLEKWRDKLPRLATNFRIAKSDLKLE